MPVTASIVPLHRRGAWYESLDSGEVFDGGHARVCLAPPILLQADATWWRASARRDPAPRAERVGILRHALAQFAEAVVDIHGEPQSPARFCELLDRHVGLPAPLVTGWSRQLARVLDTLCDRALADVAPGTLAAVSLPANTFLCLEACLEVLLRGAALWIRPSRREPFSAARFIACLRAVGWPAEQLGLYATLPDALATLVKVTDLATLYGGKDIVALGAPPRVTVHGPGHARALVGDDAELDRTVDWLVPLIAGDAGRFCTSVGTILCGRAIDPLGESLARRLDDIPLDPSASPWPLASWPDARAAERVAAWIEQRLRPGDRILTRRPRLERAGGRAVLLPTLVRLGEPAGHPLLGCELPFPFAVLASATPHEREPLTAGAAFIHQPV